MKYLFTKTSTFVFAIAIGLVASASAFAQANIVIQNGDSAGVGFNDATAAAPVGGNSGTTVGQQRLMVFQTAASIWGASLSSVPAITINAHWAALPCTASGGTLGSAGNSGSIWRDFTGAPVTGHWYGNALANALSGVDQNGAGTAEINATFNVNVGTPGCLEAPAHWYYGLDNNHGSSGIDLMSVVLHEFAHGLGFQTFTNSSTGAQAGSFPSIWDKFLFDDTTGKTWDVMTDSERVASAINTGNLVWVGPQVDADVPRGVLSGTPRLRINSPSGIAGNYQVGTADFGPSLPSTGITASVLQTVPNDACTAVSSAVSGRIALIDRGSCTFITKTRNAQNAGAVGVIIVDNVSSSTPPGLGGGPDTTIMIPAVSITQANGNTIKAQLGSNVGGTLFSDRTALAGTDSLGRPLMFTPNPIQSGSSVSHWDTSLTPNQLMEPGISSDLFHSVSAPQDLTLSLLKDIGWTHNASQAPLITV